MNPIAEETLRAAAPIERHEIIEERANRDAFRLCLGVLVVAAIALVVLGIALLNTTIVIVPTSPAVDLPSLAPRSRPSLESYPLPSFTPLRQRRASLPAFHAGIGVKQVGLADRAARLGVNVPRNSLCGSTAFVRHQLGSVPVCHSGRAFVVGAKSDAGAGVSLSCRPEFVPFLPPVKQWAASASAPYHLIRDGRERGSNSNA